MKDRKVCSSELNRETQEKLDSLPPRKTLEMRTWPQAHDKGAVFVDHAGGLDCIIMKL